MKEIVVASGKGGVGKTTVASSIAVYLAKNGVKISTADVDVDAPDLLLALGGGAPLFSMEVRASKKAKVDPQKCIGCGDCVKICPFGAMIQTANGKSTVARLMCEGCGVCKLVCPTDAIIVEEAETGSITIENTRYGFSCITGKLRLGEHNSGLLVSNIRNLARRKAQDAGCKAVIIDAAPGIGCPVIASVTGADYLIAVTEPTPAAKRNLERLFTVAKHFQVPTGVVINRTGYSPEFERSLKKWVTEDLNFHYLGSVPLDQEVVKALVQMKPVIEHNPTCAASKALMEIAKQVEGIL